MSKIMLLLMFAILALLALAPLFFMLNLVTVVRKMKKLKMLPNKKDSFSKRGQKNTGMMSQKTDCRSLELGKQEITAVSIDSESSRFFQKQEEKIQQDRAVERLLQATEQSKRIREEQLLKTQRLQQNRKQQKDAENTAQLKKIGNRKTRKKVAKVVAKKNIELDDEKIKKIKLKAASKSR